MSAKDYTYNDDIVRFLIESNQNTFNGINQHTAYIVYLMTQKHIKNGIRFFKEYSKRWQSKDIDIVMSDDDLLDEFFEVLCNCLMSFDYSNSKSFLLYFTTSINRRIPRIFKELNTNNIDIENFYSLKEMTIDNEFDSFLDDLFKDVCFTEVEEKIIHSFLLQKTASEMNNEFCKADVNNVKTKLIQYFSENGYKNKVDSKFGQINMFD